jgi:hypothetical protein
MDQTVHLCTLDLLVPRIRNSRVSFRCLHYLPDTTANAFSGNISKKANAGLVGGTPEKAVPNPRRLVWVKTTDFQGYGCSQCAWVFQPSGAFVGESLDKMTRDYRVRRDKEFFAHVCAEHFTSSGAKEK